MILQRELIGSESNLSMVDAWVGSFGGIWLRCPGGILGSYVGVRLDVLLGSGRGARGISWALQVRFIGGCSGCPGIHEGDTPIRAKVHLPAPMMV